MPKHYSSCFPIRKGTLLASALLLGSSLTSLGATLRWVGTSGASIAAAASWVEADPITYATIGGNAVPGANDRLVFDGSQTPSPQALTIAGNQLVGQLLLVNNANVELRAPTTASNPATLTIGNPLAGDDFVVSAGSTLTILSTTSNTNRYVVISLVSGATGSVGGTVSLNGNDSSPIPQRLVAGSAGAIQFENNSRLISRNVLGFPLGTTGSAVVPDVAAAAGSVVFNAGATFEQLSGDSPFGNGPNPVAVFNSGSTYIYSGGIFSLIGQQYGNLQLLVSPVNASGVVSPIASTQNTTILNNLLVGNGTTAVAANFNSAATSGANAGTTINGNITVASGSTLGFAPAIPASLILSGAAAQTISGAGTISFGPNTLLEVRNSSGVALQKSLTVPRGLVLSAGLLNVAPGSELLLPTSATVTSVSGTTNTTVSNSSYVTGIVTRTNTTAGSIALNTSSGTGLFFPIGDSRAYRPVSMALNQTSATATGYSAQVVPGPPPTQVLTATIQRVSRVRHYVVGTTGGSSFINGQITLYYGTDDQVDAPSKLRIAKSNGGTWTDLGGAMIGDDGTTYLTFAISSSTFFNTLGNFVLASTELSGAPGNNPLPVELTSFVATRQSQNVYLKWTTASEKNNAYFEVQRSTDGKSFTGLGTVKGHGTTATGAAYSFTDRNPLAATAYYRLRQVNLDATEAYSSVVAVIGTDKLEAAIYPNPTTGLFTLPAISGLVTYRIYSVTGQQVSAGQVQGNTYVDIRKVPAGIYFIELITNNTHHVQRFVKL